MLEYISESLIVESYVEDEERSKNQRFLMGVATKNYLVGANKNRDLFK